MQIVLKGFLRLGDVSENTVLPHALVVLLHFRLGGRGGADGMKSRL